jgi:hypothetical protein
MPNEIDALFVGLLGGGIGSIMVFSTMYVHFHFKFKNYFYNKEHFKTRMKVLQLEDDIASMKIQLARLNAEAYHAIVEDEYR